VIIAVAAGWNAHASHLVEVGREIRGLEPVAVCSSHRRGDRMHLGLKAAVLGVSHADGDEP
jgi:hypothetical protein